MSKVKKCPYCGKRISYVSCFSSRRKAEYVCPRCEKESRVVINKKVIILFAALALLSLVIMALWIFLGLSSNPLGILLVALPLIIFGFVSARFVRYEPYKKYKNSMEAKKAGIEYSDSMAISEIDDELSASPIEHSGKFKINTDLFNQIKAERNTAHIQAEGNEISSNSEELAAEENKPAVPPIESIRENHSAISAPLKRINTDKSARARHYIEQPEDISSESYDEEADGDGDSDVKEYRRNKPGRYSGNRKF